MAKPSEFVCAFCRQPVKLSKDGKSVLRHVNVKGFCGGSYEPVEIHLKVRNEEGRISVPDMRVVRKADTRAGKDDGAVVAHPPRLPGKNRVPRK
jgi:hypothetical protein